MGGDARPPASGHRRWRVPIGAGGAEVAADVAQLLCFGGAGYGGWGGDR